MVRLQGCVLRDAGQVFCAVIKSSGNVKWFLTVRTNTPLHPSQEGNRTALCFRFNAYYYFVTTPTNIFPIQLNGANRP
jgi:hypothetical protein